MASCEVLLNKQSSDGHPPQITSGGMIKACDFGQALNLILMLLLSDVPAAALHYRSRESVCGDNAQTPANDMWATGCIFAELLSGKALFDGDIRMIRC